MSGLTSFLFEGKPPASVTSYGSSTSTLPSWYNDYTQGLIGKANAIAATPYQAFTGQRVAENTQLPSVLNATQGLQSDFNKNFNPAMQNIQGLQGSNALGQYGGAGANLFSNASQVAQTGFNPAYGMVGAAGMTPASAGISNYMNPYTSKVVDEIGRLGQENLRQSLSNIGGQFIGGGQFGSSRMGQAFGGATRNALRDIAGQQSQALQSGYTGALGASQQDLSRQLQAGSQLGSLASTQLSGLQNLGSQYGQFGQSDLQRQLEAAKTQAGLAQTGNQVGLQNIAALEASGQSLANQQQKGLDTAYQEFINQRDYPQQQASFMNNIIRGLQIPTSTQTTATGLPNQNQLNPSPLAQIASAGAGLAGLGGLIK